MVDSTGDNKLFGPFPRLEAEIERQAAAAPIEQPYTVAVVMWGDKDDDYWATCEYLPDEELLAAHGPKPVNCITYTHTTRKQAMEFGLRRLREVNDIIAAVFR
jgi:hypothetical protein